MNKSNYIDIKETSASKSFNMRSNLLGLDIDKQCEMLNKMYDGKIEFNVETITNTSNIPAIFIKDIDDNVRILELPECEHLRLDGIGFFKTHSNVGTVKLPKCIKEVEIRKLKWYFPKLKTVFAWEGQELFLDKRINPIGYDLVILRNEKGEKTKILRNV